MRKLRCWLGLHQYEHVKKLTGQSSLIQCSLCNRYFGVHFPTRVVLRFDSEMYGLYKRLGKKGLKKYIS